MNRNTLIQFLVIPNVVPSWPILVILMMEAIRSSESRFLQEPQGVTSQKTAFILLNDRRENFKSYKAFYTLTHSFHIKKGKENILKE
jgi:hypothetical protein